MSSLILCKNKTEKQNNDIHNAANLFKSSIVIFLIVGQTLKEMVAYSVFVRVWYNSNTYAVFKSPGITVLSKPVHVNDLQGAAVSC